MVAIAIALTLALPRPVIVADTANSAKVFSANCAACHLGGRNVVAAEKTLKKDALKNYNMNLMEAIVYQVQNVKKAIPASKSRLNAR